MLSIKTYPADYIDACQRRIDRQLTAYEASTTTADFDAELVANMILVLEHSFVHRMRGNEGKDGNPLNEVRMLAASILTNEGNLAADKSVRYKPEAAVVGIAIGEPINPTIDQFRALSDAFFATLRSKYGE